MNGDEQSTPPPPEPGANPYPVYGAPQPGYGAPPPPYGVTPTTTSGSATTSLVLGIVSLVCCLGLLTGIPAIVLGRRATKEIDASGGTIGGRGNATAGFVLGIIGFAVSLIAIALVLLPGDFLNSTCTITINGETSTC